MKNIVFGGIAPRVSPRLLADVNGQTAENCKLTSGRIIPLKSPLTVTTPTKTGSKLSIFPYDLANQKWLHWLEDVDVSRSTVANDAYGRVYWTGDSLGGTETPARAKYGVVGAITSGGTNYPQNYYHLGIPKPASALTVTPEAYSAAATYALGKVVTYAGSIYTCTTAITVAEAWNAAHWTAIDDAAVQLRAYVYTYVSEYGEEGPPSDPSAIANVGEGQSVGLASFSTAPSGGTYNVTKKRVYRTNTGTNGTEYQLVHEIDVANTTDTDSVASVALGEVLPSESWLPPPAGLSGIIALPNGCHAGFVGNQVCLSVPYQPHAWPLAYRWAVDYTIVALASYGSSIAILTQGNPFTLTGENPETMGKPERVEDGYACLSKRAVVDLGNVIAYPCPLGLFGIGVGGASLLTEKVYDADSFVSYAPTCAYQWQGKYVAMSPGWIFDPRTNDLTTHTVAGVSGYHDKGTGALYVYINSPVGSGPIAKWDANANLTAVWESKDVVLASAAPMTFCEVLADAYPVTLKVYRDGSLMSTLTISDGKPARTGSLAPGAVWKFRVEGAMIIHSVSLVGEIEDIING